MPIKSIKFDRKKIRTLIILLALAGLLFFVFSFKWYLAHTISTQAQYTDVADLSISLAPDDPQTHFASAVLHERTFLPEDLQKSLAEYKMAAALTPNNYLAWIDLGKAYEKNGDADLAEKSFRRSEQLAPHYADVKWILGNFLLRKGNSDEGFEKIRFAAETNDNFIQPYISLVWQSFDGDTEKIKKNIGDSTNLKSAFAVFLASQSKFDESMEIWNSLTAGLKKPEFKKEGEEIYNFLIVGKRFLQALEVKNQISETANPGIGKINNGGFENDVQTNNSNLFDWKLTDGLQPAIGFDNQQKNEGTRSLVFIYNSADGREFRTLTQTLAVKSGAKYQLKFFYKSDLKTSATVKLDVINASNGNLIASSNSLKAVSDWSSETIDFTVPENAQGIAVNLSREQCKTAICPISGKLWLDDFSLTEF